MPQLRQVIAIDQEDLSPLREGEDVSQPIDCKLPYLTMAPHQDMVVILPDPVETVKEVPVEGFEKGVQLPDSAQKLPPATGLVVAVGPGKYGVPMQSKEGQHVLYTRVFATRVELSDGKSYDVIADGYVVSGLE